MDPAILRLAGCLVLALVGLAGFSLSAGASIPEPPTVDAPLGAWGALIGLTSLTVVVLVAIRENSRP